jgi:hypothetical protein
MAGEKTSFLDSCGTKEESPPETKTEIRVGDSFGGTSP